jgi:flavin reductase (DIM6/NTAB) family NADH-FMN oxidoreductase RutF
MTKHIVPKEDEKYFGYYPNVVVVVGVIHDEKSNFMPVAWNTALSYNPFMYGVSIDNTRYTYNLIRDSKAFSVNFLSFENCHTVRSLGRSTGDEIDKAEEFDIEYTVGKETGAPLMDNSYCAFECQKRENHLFGDHTLFVGKVVLIKVARNSINKDNLLDTKVVSPLLYLGMDNYITTDTKSLLSLKDLPFHYKNK